MKEQFFLNIVFQLKDWYKEKKSITEDRCFYENNDFSILKVMKLLFFVAAQDETLLDNFKFQARPLGPVEDELYYDNKAGNILGLKLTEKSITELNFQNDLNASQINLVNQSIERLKKENPDIVNYPASRLVNISHKWRVWEYYYKEGYKSEMPNNKILNTSKYYY